METVNRVKQLKVGTQSLVYVYVIKGQRDYYYCGITDNICRRFYEHQTGKGKSTAAHTPYVIKYLRGVRSRGIARFIEVMIKRQGVRKWMQKIQYSTAMAAAHRDIEKFVLEYRAYKKIN